MVFDLKDKVAVITGGAGGIGFETAGRFLEKGAKVVLLDIDESQGLASAKNLNTKYGKNKAVFFKCDVTSDLEEIYKKIIAQFKTVDILMNNAGILNDRLIKKTIDINVTAVIEWSFKFWEHMRTDKGGKGGTIINVASIYGYRADQFVPVYHASKFAVMGFTKSLGHVYNYNRTGVRVVAICPGFTETNILAQPKTWDDPQLQNDFTNFVAAHTWQKVDCVGKAAVEIFETKESGTAWETDGPKPLVQV